MSAPQNYKNHSRVDPLFHFFLGPMAVANFIVVLTWHIRHRTVHPHLMAWAVFMSIVFLVAVTKIRNYALKNQDRIICLEEKLRYQAVLTPELMERSAILSVRQIIALRFASDGELTDLIKRTLSDGLDEKTIKQSVQHWRADHNRV